MDPAGEMGLFVLEKADQYGTVILDTQPPSSRHRRAAVKNEITQQSILRRNQISAFMVEVAKD